MPETKPQHTRTTPCSAVLLGDTAAHLSLDRKNMRRLGIAVEAVFDSGRKAALHLLKHTTHVVVCDRKLADMSAPEFVRLLQLHPRLRCIPVLIASTDNTREAVLEAKQAGCGSYLIRPYSQAAFARQVSQLLARGRMEKPDAGASAGAFFEALEALDGAERTSPPADPAETAFSEGRRMLGLRRYDEAAQFFRTSLKLRPDFAEAAHGLAKAWKGLGHPAAYKETLLQASGLYLRQDRLGEAFALTEELRKLDPLVKDPVQHAVSNCIRSKDFSRAARLLAKNWSGKPIPKNIYDQIARDCHFTDDPLAAAEVLSEELAKKQTFLEPEQITRRIMGPPHTPPSVRPTSPRAGLFGSLRDVFAVAKYTVRVYRKGNVFGRA